MCNILQSVEFVQKALRDSEPYCIGMHLKETCWKAISMLRHDKAAQLIHWDLCGRLGYNRDKEYYNREPQPVFESTNNKVLCMWDFKIQTDNKIEHNKPDITVLDTDRTQMPDYWCCLPIWHPGKRQRERERENWELPSPEAGVETDLDIAQSNCGANHN